MRRRPLLAPTCALLLAGCANLEGPSARGTPDHDVPRRAGTPSWTWTTTGGSVDRPVADPLAPRRATWIVDVGLAPGPVPGGGAALGGGLVVALRTDHPSVRAETASVEEGTATGFAVGAGPWPGGLDPAGAACAGAERRVEWLVCLRSRGTCAVEVDAVPQLVGGGTVTALERYRVRRVVQLDEALVIGADAARAPSAEGAALVGGSRSRFVLRVRA